jgi:hypothetical protein
VISDVLSDAVAEIERYQRDMPGCYDGLRDQIEAAKAVMDALRTYLDFPPPTGRHPAYDAALGRLHTEIARISMGGVSEALNGVRAAWPLPEEIESARDSRPSGPGDGRQGESGGDR